MKIEMMKADYEEELLKKAIDRFPLARILVLGDIILDEYLWGNVSRISPEAPVPVVDVQQETRMLGGAANVIHNLYTLGARPILCGVIGDDATGIELVEKIRASGLSTEGLHVESGRPTSMKTRVVAHNQQVVRFDKESRKELQPQTSKKLLEFVEKRLPDIDAVIVSDYGKGVVSGDVMKGLTRLTAAWNGVIGVDPKIGSFSYYHGVDVITPNHHEAGAYCGLEIDDRDSLVSAGRKMLETLECGAVLITQGRDGMTLFERDGEIQHIPTVAREVYDVTGAGDTVIATFCLGLASGLNMRSSAIISNFAAGIVVGEVGTSAVRAEDLKMALENHRVPRHRSPSTR